MSRKKLLKIVNHLLLSFGNPWLAKISLGRLDWLICMQCLHKTFHFLSASGGPRSILSDIVISLQKSHEIILVTDFWKTKNTCERCFWDASHSKLLLVYETSWRRLQHAFSVTILRLSRRLEDALEDEKLLCWRSFQDVLKTCREDLLKTCLEGVLKAYLEDVFKTSCRQKCLLVISASNKYKCVSNKSIFHKSISDKSKANPKCVT